MVIERVAIRRDASYRRREWQSHRPLEWAHATSVYCRCTEKTSVRPAWNRLVSGSGERQPSQLNKYLLAIEIPDSIDPMIPRNP